MQRSKPLIGDSDMLDELSQQAAEAERECHEAGECWRDCSHCEHEREAEEWRRDCEQRRVFERLTCKHNAMVANRDSETHAWKCADCGYIYGQDEERRVFERLFGEMKQWLAGKKELLK